MSNVVDRDTEGFIDGNNSRHSFFSLALNTNRSNTLCKFSTLVLRYVPWLTKWDETVTDTVRILDSIARLEGTSKAKVFRHDCGPSKLPACYFRSFINLIIFHPFIHETQEHFASISFPMHLDIGAISRIGKAAAKKTVHSVSIEVFQIRQSFVVRTYSPGTQQSRHHV